MTMPGEQERPHLPLPRDEVIPNERAEFVRRLYTRHDQALQRFLGHMLRSPEDVAEVAQDVYLRIIGQDDFDKLLEYPRAYLFRTATNLVRDRLRRQRVRMADRQVPLREQDIACPIPSPEVSLQWKQSLELLKAALRELAPLPRKIFLMHRIKQLTYAEISNELGISVRTIERHMRAVLIHCRTRLENSQ